MFASYSRTIEFELVLSVFFRIIQFELSYAEFEFKIISLIKKYNYTKKSQIFANILTELERIGREH